MKLGVNMIPLKATPFLFPVDSNTYVVVRMAVVAILVLLAQGPEINSVGVFFLVV